MPSRAVLGLVVGLGLTAIPAWAQDAEQLRRELEQIKKQFETMKDGYQKAIESLQKRIESLESRPAAPAIAPAPAPGGPTVGQAPPAAPPASERPGLMDLARPREPYELYRQRGPGQLLFDIGVIGDFVGDFTSGAVASSDTCTFPGGCNRFFPRAVEIGLYGQVDPYASAVVILEAGEEFDGSDRSFSFQLSEAYLNLLTLPSAPRLGSARC